MTTTKTKNAVATPAGFTTNYNVTYPGSRGMDCEVGYSFLLLLASRGYTVQVAGVAFTPAHQIDAK